MSTKNSKLSMRFEKSKDGTDISRRERHNIRSQNVSSSNGKGIEVYGIKGVANHIKLLEKAMNKELKANGKRAIRKDAVRMIEVIASSDDAFFQRYDYKQYFDDCKEFLCEFWGQDNVLQYAIHLDESTEHAHFLVTPIKDGKFNYSAYIDGRDDLSEYQQAMEDFMRNKGYEFKQRDLASVTRKKHQTTREWSKKMQKAENMVDLMDERTLRDNAIDGIVSSKEVSRLSNQVQALTEANISLKNDLSNAEEERDNILVRYNTLNTGVKEVFGEYKTQELFDIGNRALEQLAEANIKEFDIENELEQ